MKIKGETQGQGDGDTHGRMRKINSLRAPMRKKQADTAPLWGCCCGNWIRGLDVRHGYRPTDDEGMAIDRNALRAALDALAKLSPDADGGKHDALACLQAFKAVREATREAERVLLSMHPECQYVEHFTEHTQIVCSAMFCHIAGLSTDDVQPHSVAGGWIASLLSAAKVLEGMQAVYAALDDDDEVFGAYLAEEAVKFASPASS